MTQVRMKWIGLSAAAAALAFGVIGAAAASFGGEGEPSTTQSAVLSAAAALAPSVSGATGDAAPEANLPETSAPETAESPVAFAARTTGSAEDTAQATSAAPAGVTGPRETNDGASQALASESAAEAHTNGLGCDDILHAEDAERGPGGPVGCEAGNSGGHRQNGVDKAGPDEEAEEGEGPDGEEGTAETPDEPAAADEEKLDPHANGHGCDDIIHAEGFEKRPGGPVGCTVGNSGEHRQNGVNKTEPEEEAAEEGGSEEPVATSTDSTDAPASPGKSAGRGKGHK